MKHYYVSVEARDAAVDGLNLQLTAEMMCSSAKMVQSSTVCLGKAAAEMILSEEEAKA